MPAYGINPRLQHSSIMYVEQVRPPESESSRSTIQKHSQSSCHHFGLTEHARSVLVASEAQCSLFVVHSYLAVK